ncbi:hypothetical protein C8Q80DRAFT_1222642 [Daedaleopsis nitida]|nr:hypothetical protein C8Q80DRAFT_1222642 [Daedaleopsis nitida]
MSSGTAHPANSSHSGKDSTCAGCGKPFTVSGLAKHLSMTRKPACVTIREADQSALLSGANPSVPPISAPPTLSSDLPPFLGDDIDLDRDPIAFEGDFFGDYDPKEFDDFDVPPSPPVSSSDSEDELETARKARNTYVIRYPRTTAGAPIPHAELHDLDGTAYQAYQKCVDGSGTNNPYAPFTSRVDWEVARWAKLRGSGSTAFSDLLGIEQVAERLALSYKNSRELNEIIDEKLPSGRPRFQRHEIIVSGEAFEVFFRDIIQCIEALFGDPEFAPLLLLVPERHYTDATRSVRVYFDMNTGQWWWATQAELEKTRPGATIIPVIISSDKTQLTLIGNKTAYPVYMTIGNLPKDIRCKPSRRGQILLAYLPTSRLLHITNKAARRRTLANLFHACMTPSGVGLVYRGHPLLAVYVGDYPEQLLVTGGKHGECPKCPIPRDEVGNDTNLSRPLRNLEKILQALASIDEGPRVFTQACRDAGIKPLFHPFWEELPYTNIFYAITPDILHQLYQGVVKHLVAWLKEAYGPAEIDARCRRLPPNHNLRHFSKGISSLSRVTGKEHQDISRILLGLIIGLPLSNGVSSARLVRATRALLDFLYLAQYPTHTSRTLDLLGEALKSFHANKEIFVDLGIHDHFHLPKLHSLDHYKRSIELYGTTDNYDTQYSERLHIDLAKDAYRATNRKDELSQMTIWLERKEKVQRHEKYIEWRLRSAASTLSADTTAGLRIEMTRHPSAVVKVAQLPTLFGARFFRDTLARFIVLKNNPSLTPSEVELASAGVFLNFRTVPVYHKVKFWVADPHGLAAPDSETRDVVHVRPARKNKHGTDIPGRFDTALIRVSGNDSELEHLHGMQHLCVAQVRVVFKIPSKSLPYLFPRLSASAYPHHLAYVKWFTRLNTSHPDHGLYRISRSLRGSARLASIIPIEQLERSCHLYPDFGPVAPREWTSSTVLEDCSHFYVNAFADRNMYKLVY